MPSVLANIAASQTDSELVAAVTNRRVKVLGVFMMAGAVATNVTFNSKPSGAGSAISCLFACPANGGAVLPLSQLGWFQTALSEGLTVTTSAGSTVGIQVVYEYAA